MQFQVPQFIETEDRVVGALTLKQFAYIAAAAILIVIFFVLFEFWLWLILTVIVSAIGLALAFIKVNGRPLMVFFRAFFDSFWRPKIYVFDPRLPRTEAEAKKIIIARAEPLAAAGPEKPTLGGIKGLWQWIATSKTAIPRREQPLPRNFGQPRSRLKEKYELVRRITGEREVAKRVDYR
ncbi:MAG: PrgI family protein [Candidatus Colwellbacteria bacterium]|nr:PrgI family protein [Candidatus Colwellbacteria bacterium]